MMAIINAADQLGLTDWSVCAGFVRSKIWDTQHNHKQPTPLQDIDVVYFNPNNISEAAEKALEDALRRIISDVPWSVKNQARMHLKNNFPPYCSTEDAISKFPETATALGITMDECHKLVLIAPHGIEDAIAMKLRPTPHFRTSESRKAIFYKRVHQKNWQAHWPMVSIANE
ncbi:nucleotidyltransferase family protein [Amphibacillus marinus]|nr:nucleotidyltransferase family protein [Amphibacillus marinus]